MRWTLVAIGLVSGCDSGEVEHVSSGGGSTKGSSGGFSADLAKQLGSASAGSGSATGSGRVAGGSGSDGDAVKAGSGSALAAGSGSAIIVAAGSAVKVGSGSAVAAGSAVKVGSGSAVAAGSGSAIKVGSGSAVAGSGSAVKVGVVVGAGSGSSMAINTGLPRVAVKPPAEIAAIKLSLSPNWDRDVGEAATISLVVKVPGRDESRVFSFRYGYEDAKAPADRDAYKKWLADNKILSVSVDRQRGAAWYLEGTDGAGAPAFRFLVNYGGKKLICGGLLYKDAGSNQLGDIRDKTVIQAKEICETVTL
jgi:hypothetical protein